jgi:flagellar biosynthesis GTPase FlhF
MQIKRFEAKNMKTALRLIKKELGSDAVILSARSLKKENKIIGRVKSLGVEVTAAVDGSHLPAEIKPVLNANALNSYRRNATRSLPCTVGSGPFSPQTRLDLAKMICWQMSFNVCCLRKLNRILPMTSLTP